MIERRKESHTNWEKTEGEIIRLKKQREKLAQAIKRIKNLLKELEETDISQFDDSARDHHLDEIKRYTLTLEINEKSLQDHDDAILYWENEKESAGTSILEELDETDAEKLN